jgi:phytanoyl-CoA hydroxylase
VSGNPVVDLIFVQFKSQSPAKRHLAFGGVNSIIWSMLSSQSVEFYHQHGYLRIPSVFASHEADALASELDRLVAEWSIRDQGWTGPWRKAYMDEETEKKSKLVTMHDLQFYSATWFRALTGERLVGAIMDLIGPDVELHHSTMHIKPPETGHPFPLHQDGAFYSHADERYVDALVHLDDTCHANGEIRFLDASHRVGPLKHVTQTAEGVPCTPHLPTDQYHLEQTVPVPAKRGDVVVFNINTIHGSHINTTSEYRRLVRVGYRHPGNVQIDGHSLGRAGLMVAGFRPRREGEELFPTSGTR